VPAVSVVATPAGTSSTAASTPVALAAPIPAATAALAVPTDVSILNPAAYEKLSDTNKESEAAFRWKHEDIEVPDYPFTGPQPGPANCPPQLTLLAAFHTLWPDSLLDHIVSKTNLYEWTHQNINDFKQPEVVGFKGGWPVPNRIHAYCNTLGYVDQANSYCLHYCWCHHTLSSIPAHSSLPS